jgi:hypothetical protein
VSNKSNPIAITPRAQSALDQFLPEQMFAATPRHAAIDPSEVQLDPIVPRRAAAESVVPPRVTPPSAQVQAWPMVAAAMVALGVSLLAFAMFAKFGLP